MGEEKKIKRRDYLKYTGAAIGGLVVGGALGYLLKPAEVIEKTVTAPGVTTTTTSVPSPTIAPGAITLEFWNFGGIDSEHAFLTYLVDEFNKKNPKIQVTRTQKSWMTKREDLITAWSAGTEPHVLSQDTGSLADFAEMGVYIPLSDVFTSDWYDIIKGPYVPEVLECVKYKDKYWGIPTYFDGSPFLVYNTKMFEEAGLVDSEGKAKPPETWDELIDYAKQLNKGEERWGILFPSTSYNDMVIFSSIAYQNGGRFLDPEGKRIEIDDLGWIDTLRLYADLRNKYKVASPGVTDMDYMKVIELFFSNKCAMAICMSWVPAIESAIGVKPGYPYKLTRFPTPKEKTGKYESTAMLMDATTTFYITSRHKYRKEAWEWLKWIHENVKYWGPNCPTGPIMGRMPALKWQYGQPEYEKVYPDIVKLYKEGKLFKGALPFPSFKGIVEIQEKILLEAVQAAVLGSKTPEEALKTAQPKAQTAYETA